MSGSARRRLTICDLRQSRWLSRSDPLNGLWADICLSRFGRVLVRGSYVEESRSRQARRVDVRAYLLVGNSGDSGNLKGLLRKLGRAYEQDAFVYKNYIGTLSCTL